MLFTLSNLVVQFCINGFGENDIAAFAVYFKVENLIYLPFAEKISYWGWFLISVVTTFIVYIVCYFLFARRLNSEQPAGERGVGVYLFSLTTAYLHT